MAEQGDKHCLTLLGVETSCDETAAAVVRRGADGRGTILSNLVHSQLDAHAEFGGVVPEIAARAHVEIIDSLVAAALKQAGTGFDGLDGVGVTAGPGLIGGLMVGMMTAKAIAAVHGLPLLAINHLEGHALTVGLSDDLMPPYLLLLVSGGHTQLLIVHDVGRYERLGTTLDDALGETFDKTAKLLELGYPGGPAVERCAAGGNTARFKLPRPMMGREGAHFSFSGLKTAIRKQAFELAPLNDTTISDLCASFEQAIVDVVNDRTSHAIAEYEARLGATAPHHLVVAGGVAANKRLKAALSQLCSDKSFTLTAPTASLCTDNAAMIAWAAAERLARGWRDGLDTPAHARWPLDANAPPATGAGVKA